MKNVDKLQGSIRGYENAIICLSGIRATYLGIKEITRDVQTVVESLEEICCAALLGDNKVESMLNACKFLYQQE
jgi:hypothetical protein